MNDKFVTAGRRHLHCVDIYLCKQRRRCGHNGQDENILCLPNLAQMASLDEPSDVISDERPPIMKGNERASGKISVMTCIVMCGGEDEHVPVLRDH